VAVCCERGNEAWVPKRQGIRLAAAEKLSAFEGLCTTEFITKAQTFL
jgi:hypothetical protein